MCLDAGGNYEWCKVNGRKHDKWVYIGMYMIHSHNQLPLIYVSIACAPATQYCPSLVKSYQFVRGKYLLGCYPCGGYFLLECLQLFCNLF